MPAQSAQLKSQGEDERQIVRMVNVGDKELLGLNGLDWSKRDRFSLMWEAADSTVGSSGS